MVGRAVTGRMVFVAAVSTEALAGFLPWLRSGQRERDGFELVDAARSLDVLDAGWQRALAVAWYLVPLTAALSCLALLLRRRRTAAGLAVGAGVVGVAVTLVVELARIPALPGLHVSLAAAVAAVVAGSLELSPLARGQGRRTHHGLAHEPG
jgi:lipopolysaccharide export LptBFGC system permease protein LptF